MPVTYKIILPAMFCACTALSVAWSPAYAQQNSLSNQTVAPESLPSTEKRLHLYSLHTEETVDVVFWRNGHFVPEGLHQLKHFLRDHRSGDEIDMDPNLFNLVYQLYRDSGAKGAIHIISGHRSAKTNEKLKGAGRNVAKKSQHILGTAMDIRIPGVPLKQLRDTALGYKAGGVGYYPKDNFIHIDTGRPRQW